MTASQITVIVLASTKEMEMEKVTLINDGGYIGMESVSFPVVVSVSDSNSRAVGISPQEMERIGCDMSKFAGGDGWWFVKSEHCIVDGE